MKVSKKGLVHPVKETCQIGGDAYLTAFLGIVMEPLIGLVLLKICFIFEERGNHPPPNSRWLCTIAEALQALFFAKLLSGALNVVAQGFQECVTCCIHFPTSFMARW